MILEWFDSAAAITMAAFINGIWLGALLALAVWGVLRFMADHRPVNATTRFFVWTTVFVMCIGLVIWQGERFVDDQYAAHEDGEVVPDVAVFPLALEAPASPERPVAIEALETVAAVPPIVVEPVALPDIAIAPAAPEPAPAPPPEAITAPLQDVAEPAEIHETADVKSEVVNASALLSLGLPSRIELPALTPYWRLILFTIWGTIAGMLLLRVILGWRGVWHLKQNSYPAPGRVQEALDKLLAQLDRPRQINVAISEDVQTAVAIGFRKPMILLPASMLSALSHVELEQVLLHEAAHLQRYDDWSMVFQRIISAVLFFHPGIILLGRLMDRDREFACDDWVIALTKRPKAYASCLAKLVTTRSQTKPPVFVPGFSSGKEELFDRVKTILDKKRTISFKLSKASYGAVLVITMALLVFAVQVAPVIALPDDELLEELSVVDTIFPTALVDDSVTDQPVTRAQVVDNADAEPVIFFEEHEGEPAEATIVIVEADAPAQVIEEEPNGFKLSYSGTIEGISALNYETTYASDVSANALPLPELAKQSTAAVSVDTVRDSSISVASLIRVLRSAKRIPSSGDKSQVLIKASDKMTFNEETYLAFLDAAASVQSSGDRTRVLMALVDNQQPNTESATALLQVVAAMPSSSDKVRVLMKSLERDNMPLASESVQEVFLDTIESISSSSDYRRLMKRFLEATKG